MNNEFSSKNNSVGRAYRDKQRINQDSLPSSLIQIENALCKLYDLTTSAKKSDMSETTKLKR